MKKERFIPLLACSIILFSTAACSSTNNTGEVNNNEPVTTVVTEDYPSYSSIESLAQRADTIIKGTVLSSTVEEINDLIETDSKDEKLNPGGKPDDVSNIYTVYSVKIADVYKGNYHVGDTIEVKQLGGKIGNTSVITDEKVDIKNERDYIFFLETYENVPASLLNPIQSLYLYESVAEKSIDKAKITSAHQDNQLILNMEYLQKIKNKSQ
ncbi:hypothetical protein MUB24_21615 [Lederbergia sp. NSJ-179]|uniref:hypothetical protein n=1 Tax=Lederbergia sp. NSJ-179 TaxID=2931402 RepID=UPI001FD179D6|nr:hypothetical protein [Lederbergia sp. NSJ-179]MCJ7843424.1 hypothetical protein [Lederbergia sp. NSJ-179]